MKNENNTPANLSSDNSQYYKCPEHPKKVSSREKKPSEKLFYSARTIVLIYPKFILLLDFVHIFIIL